MQQGDRVSIEGYSRHLSNKKRPELVKLFLSPAEQEQINFFWTDTLPLSCAGSRAV